MIMIKIIKGRTCPVYVCDGCTQVIDDASRGLAVWNLYGRIIPDREVDQSEIKHVHVGECDRKMVDLRTGKRYRFNRGLMKFTEELISNLETTITNTVRGT